MLKAPDALGVQDGPRMSTVHHGPISVHIVQRQHMACSVHVISQQRSPNACHVHTYLMRASLQVLIRVHCCTMLYIFIFPAQVEDLAADTWKFVEDFNDCKEVNYLCNQKHQ